MSWLKRLFPFLYKTAPPPPAPAPPKPAVEDGLERARQYLEKVNLKVQQLGLDFASGKINRAQFQELYAHYQRETRSITSLLETYPDDWSAAVKEGASGFIRKRHMAKAKAYAIYESRSGMPIATLGEFVKDPALVVPMLSSFSSATGELFGSGIRTTELGEEGWLCFVPGQHTTLLALFTNEPAKMQLQFLEQLHRLFEQANVNHLTRVPMDTDRLIFPHEYYLGAWKT